MPVLKSTPYNDFDAVNILGTDFSCSKYTRALTLLKIVLYNDFDVVNVFGH
jgi:hypothetical protein